MEVFRGRGKIAEKKRLNLPVRYGWLNTIAAG
jgi:hypothetical protein